MAVAFHSAKLHSFVQKFFFYLHEKKFNSTKISSTSGGPIELELQYKEKNERGENQNTLYILY